ncbi:hypothetical protein WDD9_000950 [Paenibacillus melissococcoides]|uniref:phage neck terminator protein n=1 Tax=Paenibacillus melissococcoides TaxID=2912268 RepID=UPI0021C3A3AE|nr:hypothetical protein [Paenibacillus melissococcoides]CAH8705364.1 hypothetical protein WDD9_000950 [Paenibacillus melissococcoides]
MIDHQQIKTAFVGPLRNYLGVTVQMQDQAVPQPPYPFIGFTFVAPYVDQSPYGVHSIREDRHRIEKLARVTISITCYAKSSQDGYRISGQARDWFQGIGRNLLKDAGIVVVKLEATTARDTLLTYDYERRIGFDVHLRMVDVIEYDEDMIEKIKMKSSV